tara:strand:+ start:224 stop:2746 length:2523 start_codon:yes stop_codon:yes gene_type:complete
MRLNNIEQLKSYYQELPWYKKILFPGRLHSALARPAPVEPEVCEAFRQAYTSWTWFFYNWIFADLSTFSEYTPNFDLCFTDKDEADLTEDQKTLRSAYHNTRYPQPIRAVCLEARDYLDRQSYLSVQTINQWPEALQILVSENVITPNQASGNLSATQKNLIASVIRNDDPIGVAQFIASVHPALETLSEERQQKVTKLVEIALPALLKIPPNVSKNKLICVLLKYIEGSSTNKLSAPNAQYLTSEVEHLISSINKLTKICDDEKIFDLVLEQLDFANIYSFHMSDIVLRMELLLQSTSHLNSVRELLSGNHGAVVLEILMRTPESVVSHRIRLLNKLERLSTLRDEEKTFLFSVINDQQRNASTSRRDAYYDLQIEACLNLFSRLDCVENPSNVQRVFRRDIYHLLFINKLLEFINIHSVKSSSVQVQADFEALLPNETLDDAIEYMNTRLSLSRSVQAGLEEQLKADDIYHRLVSREVFDDIFCLPTLNQFIRSHKEQFSHGDWLRVLRSVNALSQSQLIQRCTQYTDRDMYLGMLLDLIKDGSDPFVAYTIITQLDRLNLFRRDLIKYKTWGGSSRTFTHLYEVLTVWFDDKKLRDLWAKLNPKQMRRNQFRALVEQCHAVLESDLAKKHSKLHNIIQKALYDIHFAAARENNTEEAITKIFFDLPKDIQSVQAVHVQEFIADRIVGQVQTLIDQDDGWRRMNEVNLPVDLVPDVLETLIGFIELQKTPIAYFTCALLLTGEIQRKGYEIPSEKRIYDAIGFYDKAAHDVTLKPFVDYALWHLKTVMPYDTVQDKLHQYDVTPGAVVASYGSFFQEAPERSVEMLLYRSVTPSDCSM